MKDIIEELGKKRDSVSEAATSETQSMSRYQLSN